MNRSVVHFFSAVTKTYYFSQPGDEISHELNNYLTPKNALINNSDFVGSFSDQSNFSINLVSSGYRPAFGRLSSSMSGTISEVAPGRSMLTTTIRTSIPLFALFLFTIIAGIIDLFKSLDHHSASLFVAGLGLLVLGPALCVWYAGVSRYSIQERFEIYLKRRGAFDSGYNHFREKLHA